VTPEGGESGTGGNWITRSARWVLGISQRTSLRTKLVTAVLGLVIVALVVISALSTWILRSYLTTQSDSTLRTAYSAVLNSGNGTFSATPGYAYNRGGFTYGIQTTGNQLSWGPQTGPFTSTGSPDPLPELPTAQSWAPTSSPEIKSFPAQSGSDTWRVLAITVNYQSTSGTGTGTLIVAVDLGNINHTIRQIVAFDVAISAAIVLALAVVGVAVVRANLRPLEEIEETAEEIAAGHLNRRVRESDPRTEVGSLAQSLNIMLSQIETAFRAQQESEEAAHQSEERMRRFIADASHELRTPLTAIRGFAEYYRQRGGVETAEELAAANGSASEHLTAEDLDRIMHRVEAEASRMGLLVEDLLMLARLDQQRPLSIRPVDLLTLAADSVQDARMIAPDRTVDLQVAPGAAFIVDGDEARLRQVISNLVNNALTHTPAGTPVTVRIASGALDSGKPAVVLEVADRGAGLTPEQAQHVFDRFYRADTARTRATGGSGLGLSIVSSLVAAHGGDVAVRSTPGEGATFRVRLPLVAEAHAADPDDSDDSDDAGAF
jgi:two-component system OmpR family sensor kinase